jgi:hypothetical protein
LDEAKAIANDEVRKSGHICDSGCWVLVILVAATISLGQQRPVDSVPPLLPESKDAVGREIRAARARFYDVGIKCHNIVKSQKCHNIVEKLRESTLKGIRRMGTGLYLAGFAKEQRKSRVASVATCIALDLCCSEAIIKRSQCPCAVNKQVPYARLNDVVTLTPLRDVVNFVS